MLKNDLQLIRNNMELAEKYFLQQLSFNINPIELKELEDSENIKIIDVRHFSDYEISHIPNAISIPLEEIENKFNELDKESLNVVYGTDYYCNKSKKAAYILAKNSFPVVELIGGFESWIKDFRFATN